jgi:hypothetical protein
MADENQVIALLTEIRDINLENQRRYDEYLKMAKQSKIQRALSWGLLCAVMYFAVYFAVLSAK